MVAFLRVASSLPPPFLPDAGDEWTGLGSHPGRTGYEGQSTSCLQSVVDAGLETLLSITCTCGCLSGEPVVLEWLSTNGWGVVGMRVYRISDGWMGDGKGAPWSLVGVIPSSSDRGEVRDESEARRSA